MLDLLPHMADRVQQLEETNQQLRDEIARFQGQKPRPQLQPSILHLGLWIYSRRHSGAKVVLHAKCLIFQLAVTDKESGSR